MGAVGCHAGLSAVGGGGRPKKLIAIGRAWAGALPTAEDIEAARADAARWGLTIADPEDGQELEVWEAHRPALLAWLEVAGQWRTVPVTGGAAGVTETRVVWLGLDYAAAAAGLTLAGRNLTPEVWAQVRIIEGAAREELNGRHG